ncbi:hypothetical protein QGX11_gp158 [Pseudomonas phage PPSC2]|uniref:Uncharacterized protein n=1 Tax=Pseudomonas phage PPSC2 TaxID=2041350 RepID=A0A2R2YAW9_9CAUD|nr:hypothetical protein QGX11_gp158 [Pseudomonas phage PPSC2]ATN92921.1 hypothetical protein PPSC2_158 [Pseudomonas phage PPSC2]
MKMHTRIKETSVVVDGVSTVTYMAEAKCWWYCFGWQPARRLIEAIKPETRWASTEKLNEYFGHAQDKSITRAQKVIDKLLEEFQSVLDEDSKRKQEKETKQVKYLTYP